ncbi:PepSY-associated TM helix domain-containing protein [Erythrobacter sp. R86502]|uniref:PepSY-associated TM helix domain-containing protein n=1 Tax=Erythrobacter sp. R86502 TaxID=3093846 RepID=UPI0036D37C3A
MKRSTIKVWFYVHKWTGLASTLFLLMLCVTGLPLIFHDEIDAIVGEDYDAQLAGAPSAQGGLPLDVMLSQALAQKPDQVPLFMAFSNDSSLLTVTTGPSADAAEADMTLLFLDRATGKAIGPAPSGGIMDVILSLHVDLFLGLPGMLFLGSMGLLFVIALISGAVLYAPFMRRLQFGTLRTRKSQRVKRLDQHNLLGIVTLGWALVVGLTGVINTLADPLTAQWQNGELAAMTAKYAGVAPVAPDQYASLDNAMISAQAALPGRDPQFIAFPGGAFSTGHHYAVFFQGDSPATQFLLTPALIDARNATLTDAGDMPKLNQALMLSKPLHFGDYGGLALKILWALLDLATIWVLWTGVLLWLRREPGRVDRRIDEIATGAMARASS